MSKIGISLGRYNTSGVCASIDEDDGHSVWVAVNKSTENVGKVCKDAAEQLRTLADAFETLADLPDPFKDKTHRVALATAKLARKVRLNA